MESPVSLLRALAFGGLTSLVGLTACGGEQPLVCDCTALENCVAGRCMSSEVEDPSPEDSFSPPGGSSFDDPLDAGTQTPLEDAGNLDANMPDGGDAGTDTGLEDTGVEPPPGPGILGSVVWSEIGALEGMHCILVTEPADPDAWDDNYLCSLDDLGFLWSFTGPIEGMHCVQWLEASDPNTWDDNFLCSSVDYRLVWSSAGELPGHRCLAISESADPHTWDDNFLCEPSAQ